MALNIFNVFVEFEKFVLVEGGVDGNQQLLGFLPAKDEVEDQVGDVGVNIPIGVLQPLHWFFLRFILVLVFLKRDFGFLPAHRLLDLVLLAGGLLGRF